MSGQTHHDEPRNNLGTHVIHHPITPLQNFPTKEKSRRYFFRLAAGNLHKPKRPYIMWVLLGSTCGPAASITPCRFPACHRWVFAFQGCRNHTGPMLGLQYPLLHLPTCHKIPRRDLYYRNTKPIPRWDVHFRILKTTERTLRLVISPLVTNRGGTDSAVLGYIHFTLALV